jgi:hypothetical protein
MPAPEIQWPQADLNAITRQIRRAQVDLGKDIESAVTWAAFYVARSASTRTEKAKPTRKDIATPQVSSRKRRFPYYRELWIDGPANVKPWYIMDKSDQTHKKVKRAGLAKKSWLWALPMIRRGKGSNFAVEAEKRGIGFGVEIELANKLPYIRSALKVSQDGQPILNEALGKAASQMEKAISHRIARMAK